MGFFGKLFSAGPAMNRLAKACDETLNCLRRFDISGDKDELYKAAWIFTYGVQMSLEKWNWNPFTTKVFIPNHTSSPMFIVMFTVSIRTTSLQAHFEVLDLLK